MLWSLGSVIIIFCFVSLLLWKGVFMYVDIDFYNLILYCDLFDEEYLRIYDWKRNLELFLICWKDC